MTNFAYIKKEEVKENFDVKHGIKSECKVDLKKLKIEVKTEDCKEDVHLPDDNEHVMPSGNRVNSSVRNGKKSNIKRKNDICGKCVEYGKSCLEKQKRIHKVYACKICGKEFKWKSLLLSHGAQHNEEPPFKCDICYKCFKQKGQLKSHQETHSEERPFNCDICNKGFKRKRDLKRHQNIHSEERPFKCNICNKGYKWKINLQNHQNTHKRPFKCDICNKGFKWKIHLQNHQNIHSEERPFKCNICNK
ncbi:gastrula zinc finger protein XlCGF7.1-like, partial [Centruroides sculpturatus]|uniref:gastrula zinc finger protein XlCGF7.1-like n=1 Tax=Centruroides sculpturatus TaxID=218467 RepID=UPI000C6D80BC